MNRTNEVYEELLTNNISEKKSILAFMNGILKADGILENDNNTLKIEIVSHNYRTLFKFNEYFQGIYKDTISIEYTTTNAAKKVYKGIIEGKTVYKILSDLKWCEFNKEGKIIKIFPFHNIKYEPEETVAFIQAIFLSQGSIYFPDVDEKQGYHLEFLLKDKEVADFVVSILANYGINGKEIEREDMFSVYLKDSSQISDVLALLGASDIVFEMNNIIANRTIRNQINRQNNCYIANLDKTINASEAQYFAIEKIINANQFDKLDKKLKEVAEIRINNKELSLDEIAAIVGISKSGINHRFKKIMDIAEGID